ncbi:MAG: hypothetical protein COA79_23960 [Planctomycetota bacterium]|nr:MAG: hypothetical protein COA79_23960 [Planctomycetota bacterium]
MVLKKIPVIVGDSILIRPHRFDDAIIVQELLQDKYIQQNTINLESGFSKKEIESWILQLDEDFINGQRIVFCIEDKISKKMIGCIGLGLNYRFDSGDVFFWIGANFRKQGNCSEALAIVLNFAFTSLKLNRIEAQCFEFNDGSKNILLKNGFQFEGVKRDAVKKNGNYENLCQFSILGKEFSR